jgi:hypothetical protein
MVLVSDEGKDLAAEAKPYASIASPSTNTTARIVKSRATYLSPPEGTTDPLTRPATADESVVAGHPLPKGEGYTFALVPSP